MRNLPSEVLLYIFAQIIYIDPENKHTDRFYLAFPNINLLSCTLVCRVWYHLALPLLNSHDERGTIDIVQFNRADMERLVELLTISKSYGLAHGTIFKSVHLSMYRFLAKSFWFSRIDQRLVDTVSQLLQILQPQSIGIMQGGMMLGHHDTVQMRCLKSMHSIVSRLLPSITKSLTSLHMEQMWHYDEYFRYRHIKKFRRPFRRHSLLPDPTCILVDYLRPHLESVCFDIAKFHLGFILCLGACTKIQTARFYSVVYTDPDRLAKTISCWPNLRHLTILYRPSDLGIMYLGPTITSLAHNPPHLTTLELHNAWSDFPDTDDIHYNLCSLLTHCAPTLTKLTLPSFDDPDLSGDDPDCLLLDFLVRLELRRLKSLNLSRLGYVLTTVGGAEGPVTWLPWPELRQLDIVSCNRLDPAFIRVVLRSCPKFEQLLVSDAHDRMKEIEQIMGEAFSRSEEMSTQWTLDQKVIRFTARKR